MQNFVELSLRAPEEIFVASACMGRQGAMHIALAAIFAVFIFTEADLSTKTAKFCTTLTFPATGYMLLL